MLEKIVESCRYLLDNYPGGQESKSYLDSRLNAESQEKWGFGYFPGIKDIAVLTDLVGEDTLIKSKLLTSKDIEDTMSPRRVLTNYFEDHPLIMPFRNTYGKVVGLVGRTLLDETARKEKDIAKYKNTYSSRSFLKGNLLFGLYEHKEAILEQGCVYIVEGQIDVIKASQIGLKNIVALSNNNMTPYQFSVISRYSSNIFLLLDNDVSGQKGREKILSKFGQFANIHNFYIPDSYKDIDEYITKENISDYADLSFVVRN